MRKRTLMVVLLVTIAIAVAIAGTALAKGPESATITGPGIDQPIELINNNAALVQQLMGNTGLWYGGSPMPGEPAGELGPAYTLTWINSGPPGDPIDERTIRQLLYLYAEGGPVIHTPTQIGLEGWGSDVIGWFTAPDGLGDSLAALGVPVSASESVSDVSASIEAAAAPSVEAEPADRLGYLAVVGFGLIIGLVWAGRRQMRNV